MLADEDIYRRALQLGRAGQLEDAIAWLTRHENLIAAHPAALGLMGTLLSMNEQPAAALPFFAHSIVLDPTRSVVHSDMGVALTKLNRADTAMASFDRALSLDPANVQALNNRSNHWLELRQGEPALADAERALALQPRLMAAQRQRGRALLLLNRGTEALQSIDAALALDAESAETHAIRGEILDALGRPEEAAAAFDRAAALPFLPGKNPIFTRALSRLKRHQFLEGWQDYEARWLNASFVRTSWRHDRALLERRETGLLELAGKRVLLVDEQGVGDEIMFASLIPDLVNVAASVTCISSPRLERLMTASFPDLQIATDATRLDPEEFDLVIPAGGLCRLFRNDKGQFPGTAFLRPRLETIARWRTRLGPRTTPLRVGLSWRGGLFGTGQSGRSLSLTALTPLLSRDDCEFVSLQYGDATAEVEAVNDDLLRPILRFPADNIDDFEDLAGLVLALDVVVSVQTALVHLAGAVGAPCVAMIPFAPEWRYGQTGAAMPWYGSVELLRQPEPGNWTSVLQAVASALDQRLGRDSN